MEELKASYPPITKLSRCISWRW